MQRYEERTYHPDRLLQPLVRTGPKGAGQFREASGRSAAWSVTACGAPSTTTARCPSSPTGTWARWASCRARPWTGGCSTLEPRRWTARSAGAAGAWAWGLTYPAGWPATDIESVAQADLVVAWGANMVSTHLHFWPYFLQARKRGGTIVCIDPVRTKTA